MAVTVQTPAQEAPWKEKPSAEPLEILQELEEAPWLWRMAGGWNLLAATAVLEAQVAEASAPRVPGLRGAVQRWLRRFQDALVISQLSGDD